MSSDLQLLDTPKRASLQSQSTQIRAELKDFERTFAAINDGRKPSKDDIKADTEVATKYKEYGRIRDVLAGKLDYAALVIPTRSPRKRRHQRVDSGVSWTGRGKSNEATPRKERHSNSWDLYDSTKSISPQPFMLHAIGPTPQRDGKVLGLFDLLSNSTHSARTASSNKKRKLSAMIEESPRKSDVPWMAQTPSQKRLRETGDLLQYLTGTPQKTPRTGHRRHSRTPISEGRRFMLSQFFATPSTARFSNVDAGDTKALTPLRDRVLGLTPVQAGVSQQAHDTTPAYLRRSTSFKDRLLSASKDMAGKNVNFMDPPMSKVGPPTLRHLRSVPKLFSAVGDHSFEVGEDDDDEDEDELEALREMESGELNVLVRDSQSQHAHQVAAGDKEMEQTTQKVYKKRGQKRSTRRSNIRPTRVVQTEVPKFVAGWNVSEGEDDEFQIDETQLDDHQHRLNQIGHNESDTDVDFVDTDAEPETKHKVKQKQNGKKEPMKEKSKSTPTINPNAVSHMNFRTLKIRNKNSKAKGRGRFGRGRR